MSSSHSFSPFSGFSPLLCTRSWFVPDEVGGATFGLVHKIYVLVVTSTCIVPLWLGYSRLVSAKKHNFLVVQLLRSSSKRRRKFVGIGCFSATLKKLTLNHQTAFLRTTIPALYLSKWRSSVFPFDLATAVLGQLLFILRNFLCYEVFHRCQSKRTAKLFPYPAEHFRR